MSSPKRGLYANFFKRTLDLIFSLLFLVILFPVFLILTVVGAIMMHGNPFFMQIRPGRIDPKTGRERIFYLIKFRSMSNKKDLNGNLLPDAERLNGYGRFMRKTSLDELPQLFNVLTGACSFVGPRAQLVRDMTFMTPRQRRRHIVRPGITGLAQINGRNNISWEQKFEFDLQYINNGITLKNDISILFRTVFKVIKVEDVIRNGTASDTDFGDWLLAQGKITEEEYQQHQQEALNFIRESGCA